MGCSLTQKPLPFEFCFGVLSDRVLIGAQFFYSLGRIPLFLTRGRGGGLWGGAQNTSGLNAKVLRGGTCGSSFWGCGDVAPLSAVV